MARTQTWERNPRLTQGSQHRPTQVISLRHRSAYSPDPRRLTGPDTAARADERSQEKASKTSPSMVYLLWLCQMRGELIAPTLHFCNAYGILMTAPGSIL